MNKGSKLSSSKPTLGVFVCLFVFDSSDPIGCEVISHDFDLRFPNE